MADIKNLRKLKRVDLFELLVSQAERIEELEVENSELKAQLEDKMLQIQNAGSIAEAALQLNHIFEAAQQAADQYLQNIRLLDSESNDEDDH